MVINLTTGNGIQNFDLGVPGTLLITASEGGW